MDFLHYIHTIKQLLSVIKQIHCTANFQKLVQTRNRRNERFHRRAKSLTRLQAEILFNLFCEERNTRKRLEAADGVKITQQEWSFFIVHCSDLNVFSFCSHSFKSFTILLSSFYIVLVYFLSTKLSLYINPWPAGSAKNFPPESHHKAASILFSVLVPRGIHRCFSAS